MNLKKLSENSSYLQKIIASIIGIIAMLSGAWYGTKQAREAQTTPEDTKTPTIEAQKPTVIQPIKPEPNAKRRGKKPKQDNPGRGNKR